MLQLDTALTNQIRGGLDTLVKYTPGAPVDPNATDPAHVVSNTTLLLGALETLYGSNKAAAYLPISITAQINKQLADIAAHIASLPPVAPDDPAPSSVPDNLPQLLGEMDLLYAYCLSYGLVTFGFEGKAAQEQVYRLQALATQVDDARKSASWTIDELKAKFVQTQQSVLKDIEESSRQFTEALGEKLKEADSRRAEGEANASAAAEARISAQSALTQLQSLLAEAVGVKDRAVEAENEINTRATSTEAAGEQFTKRAQQIDASLAELSATAKANAQNVGEMRATVQVQLDAISAFYREIDTHKQDMLEVRKQTTADVASLKDQTEKTVNTFSSRTDAVVKTRPCLKTVI